MLGVKLRAFDVCDVIAYHMGFKCMAVVSKFCTCMLLKKARVY